MLIFIVVFGVVVLILGDFFSGNNGFEGRCYALIAYIVGALTSMICGYVGMTIATQTNYRTTYKAITSLEEAFKLAYQGGLVMGFFTVGLALGILLTLILIYKVIFDPIVPVGTDRSYSVMLDMICAYGLGGSSMALFGRVGGGIYTKAADVGADLVGKVEHDL